MDTTEDVELVALLPATPPLCPPPPNPPSPCLLEVPEAAPGAPPDELGSCPPGANQDHRGEYFRRLSSFLTVLATKWCQSRPLGWTSEMHRQHDYVYTCGYLPQGWLSARPGGIRMASIRRGIVLCACCGQPGLLESASALDPATKFRVYGQMSGRAAIQLFLVPWTARCKVEGS